MQTDHERRRADVALVEAGLFESRAKAVEAIEAGRVAADGVPIAKASSPIRVGTALVATPAHTWVSRGGLKLDAALDHFALDVAGLACLDVGASTGGFTQVLLSRGARIVHAIDVGRDQFHASLRDDPRVVLREKTDARSLTRAAFPEAFGLITCDVSFISLTRVLPIISPLRAPAAALVVLVKPQFEVGPKASKKGIVRDTAVQAAVCEAIAELVARLGWRVIGLVPSPIAGGSGNREFLLAARHAHG